MACDEGAPLVSSQPSARRARCGGAPHANARAPAATGGRLAPALPAAL